MAEKETKKLNVYLPDTKEGREILIKAIDYYFPDGIIYKDEI
ncbi:MAG: hypothetical protein AAB706_01455 [Patescibacteria group bacterium]